MLVYYRMTTQLAGCRVVLSSVISWYVYRVKCSLLKWSETRETLSPLLFDFALECACGKIQESQAGLTLSRTLNHFDYVDYVILLRINIVAINKITQIL
jgi:hypothetical protein